MRKPNTIRAARHTLVFGVALTAAVATAPTVFAATGQAVPLAAPATSTHTVRLVTGERVSVIDEPGAQPRYLVDQGTAGGYQSYQDTTGDEYVIPATAQPYLGRSLDRSLFDVSALVRDGLDDNATRLPVSMSFAAGTTPTAPAGVTLTATSGSTATGYLTPSSTSAFAAALRQRIGADVAAGHRAGTSAPVAGLISLRLAAGGATPVATPHYPLYPLRINATDVSGTPANLTVFLFNVDSMSKQIARVPVESGVARVEVPAGDYAALADFNDYDASGNLQAVRQVVIDDFVVQAGANTPALNIDESSANLPIAVRTPRPATQEMVSVTEVLGDATGATYGVGNILLGNGLFYVNATAAPRAGTAHFVVGWTGTATKASDNYAYDVAFPSDKGVPANQTYTVRPDQVATVHQRLFADATATGGGEIFDGALDSVDTSAVAFGRAQPMGLTLTHYFGTADGGEYFQLEFTPNFVLFRGPTLTYAARHHYDQDWAHGPLTSGMSQYTNRADCAACTTGDALLVEFTPFNDSTPGHTGASFERPSSEHLTVYRNGTTLVDQDGYIGAALTGIPLTPSTYRVVLDDDYTGLPGYSQSLVRHTDLTMQYSPTADPGSTLPATDDCYNGHVYVGGSACQILPVLTVNYQMPTDLTNTSHSAVQVLDLNVGHLSYNGFGSHSQITSTCLAISFDGGNTWRSVPLFGRAGHYLAAWPNPPAGSAAALTGPQLKVTATDANGDSITQTVNKAYTIGGTK